MTFIAVRLPVRVILATLVPIALDNQMLDPSPVDPDVLPLGGDDLVTRTRR